MNLKWTRFLYGIFLCGCATSVPPGNVGVVVNSLGDERGVEERKVDVGLHFFAPWKTVYLFPVFEQNITWQHANDEKFAFNFQTTEGMAVGADLGITFHLEPNAIPRIFQKYRSGLDEITNVFVKNYVRDAVNRAASKKKIEDLYGAGKEDFFNEVEESVRKDLAPIGIEVTRI